MTKTFKYGLGALVLLLLLYLSNQNSQESYKLEGQSIFGGAKEEVFRIFLKEDHKTIELVLSDSTWTITEADSFEVKVLQLDKIFDRLLNVEKEMLISSKPDKWEKFGVDDSLGRHLQLFDENDNELIHYIFGNSGQDYQHNYVRKNKSNDVYRTNDNVYFLLNTNTTYWGTKAEPEQGIKDNSNSEQKK